MSLDQVRPLPIEFQRLTEPGSPSWLVIDYRVRAWARDVQRHIAALERSGLLATKDPEVQGFLASIVDGSCTMVVRTKWQFCLEGLNEMCNLERSGEWRTSGGYGP